MASRQTVRPVYNRSQIALMLQNETADGASGVILTASVRLFTGALVPTPETPLADFTAAIATFSGYASVAVAPPRPGVNPTPGSVGLYLPALFLVAVADPQVVNTVTGYYVVGDTVGSWVMAERFESPVGMGGPGEFLDLAAFFAFPLQPTL